MNKVKKQALHLEHKNYPPTIKKIHGKQNPGPSKISNRTTLQNPFPILDQTMEITQTNTHTQNFENLSLLKLSLVAGI